MELLQEQSLLCPCTEVATDQSVSSKGYLDTQNSSTRIKPPVVLKEVELPVQFVDRRKGGVFYQREGLRGRTMKPAGNSKEGLFCYQNRDLIAISAEGIAVNDRLEAHI